MMKDDKDQHAKKNTPEALLGGKENPSTRRGFLIGLLGGLSGAAGLFRLSGSPQTAPSDEAQPKRSTSGPIDYIFTPITPQREPRLK